eukprot:TRINITY_DN13381_c0_g1_i1.p1 TRINITY_DN13381_c0_g1~~TRINITY_DN13381_c0_g1_i1.p1  ORF type:complete len:685 (+),score=55.70 TRINITY_DN13381_c0_g1_i1:117-2171(+)
MSFSPFHFGTIRLDPLSSYGLSFSDGCTVVENRGNHFEHACASFGVSRGVWYWEVQPLTDHLMQIGVIIYEEHKYIDFGDHNKGQGVGDLPLSWSVDLCRWLTFSEGETGELVGSKQPLAASSRIGLTLDIEAGTLRVSLNGNELGIALTGIKIPPGSFIRPAISIPSNAKAKFYFSNTIYSNGVQEFGEATAKLTVPSSDQAALESLPIDVLKIVLNNVKDPSALALLSTNRRFALLSRTDFAVWKDLFLSTWMALYPDTTQSTMPIKHILDECESRNTSVHHWQFEEIRQAAKDLLNKVFLFSSNCAYGDIYCTNLWKGPGFSNPPRSKHVADKTGVPSHSSILVHDGQRSYMRKYPGWHHPKIVFSQNMKEGDIDWKLDPAPSEACPVAVDSLRKLVFVSHADTGDISLRNGVTGHELSRVKTPGYVSANQYGIYVQSTKRMYVIANGTTCMCIDASNSSDIRLLWSQGIISFGQGGIVFTHAGALVVCNSAQTALDPVTGRALWRSEPLPHSQCLAVCDRTTGLLISPSNTATVTAVDPYSGKFAWKRDLPESICFGFGSAASHPNGSILFVSNAWAQPAVLFQLDAATGTEIRRFNVTRDVSFGTSCQVFIDSHGRIYAWGSDMVCCFDEKLDLIWSLKVNSLGTEAAFIDPVTMYIKENHSSGGFSFSPLETNAPSSE